MATLESLAAQMTAILQNQELATHVQALQQRAHSAEAVLAQARSSTSSASHHIVPAIDTHIIGKPDTFDGQKGWKDWSIVHKTSTPILNASLRHDQAQLSAQL